MPLHIILGCDRQNMIPYIDTIAGFIDDIN